nr:TonB-dependent receptor [Bacteroidota bacterium]
LAAPVSDFEISYNAGYTKAEYKNLKLAQNGSEINLKNKRPVFTPEYTSMLAMQYSYHFAKKGGCKIIIRGELKSIGNQYFDLENTLEQKSYSLVNTSLALATKLYQLTFWVRNLTAKKYISYAYDFGAVHLGDPGTLGVSIRVNTGF